MGKYFEESRGRDGIKRFFLAVEILGDVTLVGYVRIDCR